MEEEGWVRGERRAWGRGMGAQRGGCGHLQEEGVLLFGGYDGALRGWEPRMASGTRFVVSAHSTPVRCLLTTADGTLWSGATDGTVAQWSIDELLSSGTPQQQLDA